MLADPAESVVSPADVAFVRANGGANVTVDVFEGGGHTLHRSMFDRYLLERRKRSCGRRNHGESDRAGHTFGPHRSRVRARSTARSPTCRSSPSTVPRDLAGIDLARDLAPPGEFPYTRGIHPHMYRDRLWTMRQFAGFGNARQTNERYHFLLAQGQMGLSVAFDMPTLMGYDSDAPQSLGEVGKCGVAIDSVRDMETLFAGIDMGAITTSMTINGPAAIALAQYIVAAENSGIPRAELGGTLQADILKEYIAQKEWIFPPRPHVRIIVDMMKFCTAEMPKWNTISISGYHIREAGSTAVQELAFTLADGFAYVEAALKAGMDVDSFAPRLSFFFNSHIDFFEEICKFRAARRIYARRMRDVYGAKDPRSWTLRFHTQTAGCSATAQQPENNIVRVAYEAMAAVLGGTQSLHTNSMDEVMALPTEKSVEIALRTQQVLAYETNVTNVADPLGGSYFVEALTTRSNGRPRTTSARSTSSAA